MNKIERGMKCCSVMGCGRTFYNHKKVANPFDPEEIIYLCDRCLRAGTEAVQRGKKELTQDIYERYYITYPRGKLKDK